MTKEELYDKYRKEEIVVIDIKSYDAIIKSREKLQSQLEKVRSATLKWMSAEMTEDEFLSIILGLTQNKNE